jgi:hypothetical protein
MCVNVYVCKLKVCMYVCKYVCMCVLVWFASRRQRMCMHAWMHDYDHVSELPICSSQMSAHACSHAYIQFTCTCIHAYIRCTYMHVVHAHTPHVFRCTDMHTHSLRAHACILHLHACSSRAPIHTYIHVYMSTRQFTEVIITGNTTYIHTHTHHTYMFTTMLPMLKTYHTCIHTHIHIYKIQTNIHTYKNIYSRKDNSGRMYVHTCASVVNISLGVCTHMYIVHLQQYLQ